MIRLCAVLGSDVSQSLSPRLHDAAARALDLPIRYVPVSCPDEAAFHRSLDALAVLGAKGANVTIPYKHLALQRADRLLPAAKAISAVNTLTWHEGALVGDNTDGDGLLRVLMDLPDPCFKRVQLLGAGGAAKAAVYALKARSARSAQSAGSIVVSARSKAEALAEAMGVESGPLAPVEGASLVISALPKSRDLAETILGEWVDLASKPRVLDLAYGSLTSLSPLAKAAQERGLWAADGRAMLVEQAALSLFAWTEAPPRAIREAMWESMTIPGIA